MQKPLKFNISPNIRQLFEQPYPPRAAAPRPAPSVHMLRGQRVDSIDMLRKDARSLVSPITHTTNPYALQAKPSQARLS